VAVEPGGIVVEVVLAGLAAALGSLFAAGDAALSEIPDGRMVALAADTGRDGAAFRRFTSDPIRMLSRWLVGRIILLACATVLFHQAASSVGALGRWAPVVAVLGAVVTYGSFTEVFGTAARRRPERAGAMALVFLQPLEWLVIPVADPLSLIGRAVGRRVPKSRAVTARMTETEVEYVVSEGERAGSMAREPAEMIRKVLDFKDLTAREVMVPRRKIEGIELGTPLLQVVALAAGGKHSRYPVYKEQLDNVVGQLYVKDLFAVVRDGALETRKLAEVIRAPVMFVVENQSAAKILSDMRAKRLHMAIVSDEFGGTAGLITLEDILEEIVGDIRDEKDADAPIQAMADGRMVVDASLSIAELEHALGKSLPDDGEFESVGGLIVSRAGKVPKVGATLRVDGLNLIVREADEKRVVKVEIVPDARWPAKAS
jgi:CBS domain containing-hemolysin-like protein